MIHQKFFPNNLAWRVPISGKLINNNGSNVINNLKIVYGGSLNSENAVQLFGLDSVDGGLIGRAAINIEEFIKICRRAHSSET